MILIFNTMMLFVLIMAFPVVLPMILTSAKRRKTVLQRLAFSGLPGKRTGQKGLPETDYPIWIHALSVGEAFSSIELVKTLRKMFAGRKIYFSVSTSTGFEEAKKRLTGTADHIFFYPYDLIFVVRKVLRQVSPSLFILVESDIWPVFLLELKKRNVPAVLVNARLSASSMVGYKRFSAIMLPVLNSFRKICVQSEEQARRFVQIGVKPSKISVTGNLKFDQKVSSTFGENEGSMRSALAVSEDSRVFLAGSTHSGEERMLLHVFMQLRADFPELLMVIVPRDPDRSDEICRLVTGAGFTVNKMSRGESRVSDVVVVDIMGILGKLYAIADIAFVGGSLVDFGGHNPLEPAAFSKPVLFGPYMNDFPEISGMLLDAQGGIRVKNSEGLEKTLKNLLMNPVEAEKIGKNAFGVFQANQGAVDKTAAVIKSVDQYRHDY
ncbi:MAG: 3-deoxy-D-manno-octulosonic acid transferase [Desulfobacterales bacterium]